MLIDAEREFLKGLLERTQKGITVWDAYCLMRKKRFNPSSTVGNVRDYFSRHGLVVPKTKPQKFKLKTTYQTSLPKVGKMTHAHASARAMEAREH